MITKDKYINLPEKAQRKLRQLNYDDLSLVFSKIIEKKDIDKTIQISLINYIEKRLTKLQKRKDYFNRDMPDHEYIAKWEIK